ncbi:MAG: NYN domain-containing protein [Dehalogenimonas sp.]|uniref:NYN domain-containing protein n=1 Tax=Candidatus Dehalogenimonas loeffleri TaxID=3127115 RepID=A0ABZ2J167_9CHLR|nr:NYN domain-containing protein [Dehalogenimonas sp.]
MTDQDDRVMIFIDGSNMYHSLKAHFHRSDIDLAQFCAKLVGKRRLVRIYYYNVEVGQREEPERYKDQRVFFDGVEAMPYTELRLGRLVYTSGWPNTPPFEKGVDVMLATDMLTHCFKNNYNTGILVAGDSDFVGALQAIKDYGKHVEVALFGEERTSVPLRKVADVVHVIDGNMLRGTWKTPGPQRSRRARRPRPQQRPVNKDDNTQSTPAVNGNGTTTPAQTPSSPTPNQPPPFPPLPQRGNPDGLE